MSFETNVDTIILELMTRLKEIERLENRVFKGRGSARKWPHLWLLLTRITVTAEDEGTIVSSHLFEHTLIFELVFKDRWVAEEDPELNEEIKISRLGEILDKLKTYTVNYPKWDLLWPSDIEYAQLTRQAGYAQLDAVVELRVRKKW